MCSTHPYLPPLCYWQTQKQPAKTHQEPDAKLTEEALVVLVILLVVKVDVVQRVVGGRQTHLTTPVQLKLTLFGVNLCLFQQAGRAWSG